MTHFKKRITLFYILFCVSFTLQAQQKQQILTNKPSSVVKNFGILADAHYNFSQILTDTSLIFISSDSLRSSKSDYYWVRMTVFNPYPNNENYFISLLQPLNYTFYFFDGAKKKWLSTNSGLAIADGRRKAGVVFCQLQKQAASVLYFKINLTDIKRYNRIVNLSIILKKEISENVSEQWIFCDWLICCIVLIGFVIYNVYVYFHLKDPIYLYYATIPVGAAIYITGVKLFSNVLLPLRLYNIWVKADNNVECFDINQLLEYIGVIVIFFGFIQLTRSYLRTRELLHRCDKILRFLFYTYILVETIQAVAAIAGLYNMSARLILFDNIFFLLIITVIIIICIIAYKNKVRGAMQFLAAYIIPLIFASCASIYIIISGEGSIFPELAILSQIITFGVALISRLKLINGELKAKEIDALKLENDIATTEYRCLLIEQENKNILLTIQHEKDKNHSLQQKLEANHRELVGNNLYIHQKNKLLADLKTQIQEIDTLYPHARPVALQNIQSSLNDGQYLDAEWDKFKLHFEQVHPSFFIDLQAAHPTLTKYELRLYAYFHINLSTKEIATLLNIIPSSVRQAKARLNKKMNGTNP